MSERHISCEFGMVAEAPAEAAWSRGVRIDTCSSQPELGYLMQTGGQEKGKKAPQQTVRCRAGQER